MAEHLPCQPKQAERPRPAGIDAGDRPQQPRAGDEHEDDVDQRARTDRGDQRDPPRRLRHLRLGERIERGHQAALGDGEEIARSQQLRRMGGKLCPALRRLRPA